MLPIINYLKRLLVKLFKLAYLTDIFEALNILNLMLQGTISPNITTHHDAIEAFLEKNTFVETPFLKESPDGYKNVIGESAEDITDDSIPEQMDSSFSRIKN
ncbi:hypothetical protein CBL_12325 [Carabus blaptoides fortunei]